MKKIALLSAIALSGLFINSAKAQVFQIGVQFGGGMRPVVQASVAAPVAAVSYVDDYYYLPEVDAYYSLADEEYYYNDGITWVAAPYLPGAYRSYNWRNVRRVEVHAYRPYLNARVYRERYRGAAFNWGRYERNQMARRYDVRVERPRYDSRNNAPRPEPRYDSRYNAPRGSEHVDRGYGRDNDRNWQQDRNGRGNDDHQGRDDNRGGRGDDRRGRDERGGDRGGRSNIGETRFASNYGHGSFGRDK